MVKHIVLCADDYGYAPPISQGILDLIVHKRITATSCLVNLQNWPSAAADLKNITQPVAIGLHLNLTEGPCLTSAFKKTYGGNFPSLFSVLRRSLCRDWERSTLLAECAAQIERFCEHIGRPPDFIDGHQHVHQLPQVREVLIELSNAWPQPCYFRIINPRWLWRDCLNVKQLVIYASGTRAFTILLQAHQRPHNTSFAGIYNFNTKTTYAKQFPQFLAQVQDGGLIMCHPAIAKWDDSAVSAARVKEYAYLRSQTFLDDCAAADVLLVLPKF